MKFEPRSLNSDVRADNVITGRPIARSFGAWTTDYTDSTDKTLANVDAGILIRSVRVIRGQNGLVEVHSVGVFRDEQPLFP